MKKKIVSFLLAAAMLLTAQGGSTLAGSVTGGSEIESTGAASPANPVHHCTKEDDGSDYTEWSYVYFGSYPQTEVTGTELTEAITGATYDANGDAWVNGTKYRRASSSDANDTRYFGSSDYRYFKWERIKWRVLENNGSTLFVVADQGLDCKDYNETYTSITWENCTLRTWLNGTFYNTAFSNSEQGAIVQKMVVNDDNPEYGTSGGNNTQDNVYLLSIEEVTIPEYGFCESYSTCSASRWMQPSDYAHAMGASASTSSSYEGACWWWLRSPGSNAGCAADVYYDGNVYRGGAVCSFATGAVAPTLQINLSSDLWYTSDDGTSGEGGGSGTGSESEDKSLSITSNPVDQSVKAGTSVTFHITASGGTPSNYTYQWYYATTLSGTGTRINGAATSSYTIPSDSVNTALDGRYYYCIVSNGQYDVESERAKLTVTESGQNNPTNTPANPVHDCTKQNDGTDTTTWSYVYFGSYPQTEVTGDELTTAITGASYDANGDAWVNGTKYRRASKSDANNTGYFGESTYRYFKWERIKWRVLENNGSTLFVVADQGLDCKDYHDSGISSITWENCTLRTWLNGTFYNTAFSNSEQGDIVQQTVVNDDNPEYGTSGGNDTQDNVYLLSIEEVTNPEYGFCESYETYSASRWMQPSDYAHAMGASTYSGSNTGGNANCWWWLRSPGYSTSRATGVDTYGNVHRTGNSVNLHFGAVAPALQINLTSDLWYTSDDGTSGEGGGSGTGSESEDNRLSITGNPVDQSVKEGTSVTFHITASGGTPSNYTYQWYYATTPSGTGTRINGATASSYTIPSSSVNEILDGRYYYCIVSDGQYEVISDRAKLTVSKEDTGSGSSGDIYRAPAVTSPISQSVNEGEAVTFTVSASGGTPSNYIYQWYYATTQSGTGTRINGATASSYTIPSGSVNAALDGRYYYCIVSNGQYEVTSGRAKLTVNKEEAGSGSSGNTGNNNTGSDSSGNTENNNTSSGSSGNTENNNTGSGSSGNTGNNNTGSGSQGNTSGDSTDSNSSGNTVTAGGTETGTNGSGSISSGTGSSTSSNASVKLTAPELTIKLSAANAVKLAWNKISGATGYTIYRATAKNGTYSKIKTTVGTSYTDKKLKKGKTYYYKIEAYNASAVSAKSDAVSRKILGKPATPKQKVIKVNTSSRKFTISWKKPKNAAKVIIYCRVDNGKFKKWKTVAAKKLKASYSYKNYARGHRYSFQLRSYYKQDGVTVYSGYSEDIYTIVM